MRFNFENFGFNTDGKKEPLPPPNVSAKIKSHAAMTQEEIRGVVCNPLYVGIGPCRQQISEQEWVRYAVQEISENSAEQFLVNLLYVLRQTVKTRKL
jgi:hypothetical protein